MNVPKISSKTSLFLLLLVISTLTIIPYLGLTNFHTKGEPREAIVAKRQLDTTYKQWRRHRLQTSFFSLVYRSVVPSCRRGNRVHFAPSFGTGGNPYGNRVFSLFCQT